MEFSEGVIAFQNGEWDEALRLFTRALEDDVNNVKILDSRAAVFQKLDQPKQALIDAREICRLRPEQPRGYLRAAKVYQGIGQLDKAVKVLEAGLARVDVSKSQALQALLDTISSDIETERRKKSDHTARLPVETLVAIVRMLDPHERVRCSHVNQRWRHHLIESASVWDEIALVSRGGRRIAEKLDAYRDRLGTAALRGLKMVVLTSSNYEDVGEVLRTIDWSQLRRMRVDAVHQIAERYTVVLDSVVQATALRQLELCHPPYLSAYVDLQRLLGTLTQLRKLKATRGQIGGIISRPRHYTASWPEVDDDVAVGGKLVELECDDSVDWSVQSDGSTPARFRTDALQKVSAPWSIIRRMGFETSSWPSLQEVSMTGGGGQPSPASVVQTVHPSVRTLSADTADAPFRACSFPELRDLVIGSQATIRADTWDKLARTSPSLVTLLAPGIGLTDTKLVGPLQTWAKTLKVVDLSHNDISDKVMQAMLDGGCQSGQLDSLSVSHCTRLTGRPLMQLKPKVLKADGCVAVDPTAIDWLRQQGSSVTARFGLDKVERQRWANRTVR